ncbi:hypothetical protein VPH46_06940 [Sphingomonas sp. MJ1 (PH-R8)]|uniref:hypothetical protein n=1 Tax=Sphingomonas sp. MJ1 (PH-R8) TaxID=3112950 RepID=UPI003A8B8AB2
MMVEGNCGGCRFWNRLRTTSAWELDHGYELQDDHTGMCRRFPPVGRRPDLECKSSNSAEAARAAHWPVTWEHDWCGEFDAAVRVVA